MTQSLIEKALGPVDWQGPDFGYCKCPGESMHTSRTARRDCRVYLGPPATIHCFHANCQESREILSATIRAAIRSESTDLPLYRPTPAPKPPLRETIKEPCQHILERILAECSWDVKGNHWRDLKPDTEDWKLWLPLWEHNEVIWNGEVMDSGHERNRKNFRTPVQFLMDGPLGPFTCGSHFHAGCYSRSKENARPKYLIIESDILSKGQTLKMLTWMREFMELVMVVDTGGKSIHGWFKWPAQDLLTSLKLIGPELKLDHQTMKPSQPVRLPGVKRGENWQRVYWMA